jgi:uncharacterized protein YecT (DUF1311 family)
MMTNVLKGAIVPAALILFTSFGNVSAQHMNAKDAPCQIGPAAEETRCFIEEHQRADRELNVLYNKIRQALSPTEEGQLQAAQRLWIQFRDANCAAERDLYSGGSAAPMAYQSCLAAVTRQRTAELNIIYGWRLEKFAK